ncbi:MAG TPA: substrate-binding domain-containing protein [Thermoanaerobaculia bacterium]|nr:substrate-binding domain-containing protein [Thermoanaerobaculia bacterium]
MSAARRAAARDPVGWLALFLFASLAVYSVWPWLPLPAHARRPRTVVFYGFSILGEVMNKAVLPAFGEEWRREHGERVEFITSFAGSGTITNQLTLGVPGQVALLSLELDATRLAAAGVVAEGSWRRLPFGGVVNRTPFVILVRPGNPKGIHGFADLTRPGVRIVHPDPLTSGGANWAILAEYGSAAREHPEAAEQAAAAGYERLRGVWGNVAVQAASAQAARTQFDNGFGDALITYEQEYLQSRAKGSSKVEIVYPPSTVMSEHTLVVIERNVRAADRPLIHALVAFLWSERAQRLFVARGFRSVYPQLDGDNPRFGRIVDPFRVADFGGWARVKRDIVDGIWKARVLPEIGHAAR